MSTIGDRLGRDGLSNLASGYSVPPDPTPESSSVVFENFEGGIELSDAPESIPINAASYAIDMEVSREDAIKRAPGITEIEDISPRAITNLIEQVSLDYQVELVAIDPPYVCVKTAGSTVCTDMSIGATSSYGWRALSVAGELIFSNGDDLTYTRDFGALTATDISAEIVARTFAQVFGRVFAGGVKVGAGTYQALGIAWNAASGALNDWTGLGSGAELLIADQPDADKVISLRAIGFDVLGILNRNSLWAGYPTGDSDRPADFRPRIQSVGCVRDETAVTTPMGIMLLSDDGVLLYNINDAQLLSKPINASLLPLDYSRIDEYQAVYDPYFHRYLLKTPYDIWIYTLPKQGKPGRWAHRSAIVGVMRHFLDQTGSLPWRDAVGSWSAETRIWSAMIGVEGPGQLIMTEGSKFGVEDATAELNFASAMTPVWRTPFAERKDVTRQFSTLGFEITYSSIASSSITLQVTDSTGAFTGGSVTKTLASTSGVPRRALVRKLMTGMNVAVAVKINSGDPKIHRIKQIVLPSADAIATL